MPDLAVQNERVGGNLKPLVSRGQLIEKENALRIVGRGEEFGGNQTVFASSSLA